MITVTVYRFSKYDIVSDEKVRSRRWGTRQGIEAVHGIVDWDTATEIDGNHVDLNGLTARDFEPKPPGPAEFQKSVH